MDTVLIRAILPLFLFLLCMFLATPSDSADYYQYETKNSIAFTDDPEQIPARYAEKTATKTWAALKVTTAPKLSVSAPYSVPTWSDPGEPEVNPNHLNDCSAHITIEQVRLQVEEYNYEYFIARDECGKVVSVTRSEPTISLNR